MILCPHCREACAGRCSRSLKPSRRFFIFGSAAALAAKAAGAAGSAIQDSLTRFNYNSGYNRGGIGSMVVRFNWNRPHARRAMVQHFEKVRAAGVSPLTNVDGRCIFPEYDRAGRPKAAALAVFLEPGDKRWVTGDWSDLPVIDAERLRL